jgi:PadR family transcriptional regulator PadR
MDDAQQQWKKGGTRTLILAVLTDAPRHGYAIAREIERRSRDALSLNEGALYPALRALEREGCVAGTWEMPGSGPARRVYAITDAGRVELAKQARAWRRFTEAFGGVLGGAVPDEQPA